MSDEKLTRRIGKYKDVLGLNRRNQKYIRPYNPLSARRIADNKIITKRELTKLGIKTPELYKVIRTEAQLKFLNWDSLPKSFVLKPNRGALGNGIIIFYGKKRNKHEWIRPNGQTMNINDISLHIGRILEGAYSMGNRRDIAIIEERVVNDPLLKKYSYKGIPDIRLIVFNKVPVMAQVRLPTKRSDGKANLHAGAICVGIDIASGVTTHAMHLKVNSIFEDTYETVEETMDLEENLTLRGIKIPYWDEILEIGIKCQNASELGYLGVDIAIDRNKGPIVFEINARPGLGIQTANNAGLRPRLERVEGLKILSPKHGIRVAKNLFGGEVEEEIEAISGKQVVNLVEKITLYHKSRSSQKNDKEILSALMDTGVTTSRIDQGLASRLGYSNMIEFFEEQKPPRRFNSLNNAQKYIDTYEKKFLEHPDILRLAKISQESKILVRPVISLNVKIAGVRKQIEAVISNRSEMIYPVRIGLAELKDYLIDASKTFTK